MRYSVFWDQNALDGATEFWVRGPNRRAITSASDAIDEAQASNPRENGEPLHEGLWKIVVPPIVAVYSIEDISNSGRIVIVHSLRFVRDKTS